MMPGAHAILSSDAAEETRDFLDRALHLRSVDAGGGWLIFALPPAELAGHPADAPSHELYLMCDDLAATMADLESAGAAFGAIQGQRWGRAPGWTRPGGPRAPTYRPLYPR